MSEELIKRLREIIGRHVYSGSAVAVIDDIDRLMRELESRPAPAVQVPDGWKLVPVEPTQEMLAAAAPFPEHLRLRHPDDKTWEARMQAATAGDQMVAAQTYRKMLAAAPAPATLATEAVAQGGGVDVEKVMALVEQYGEQCEAAGYLDRSGSQDAAKRLHDAAYQTAVKIRALLSASPAGVGGWQPIETAPRKHGERILLWRDCGLGTLGSYVIGFAIDGDGDWHSNECKGLRSLESYGYRVTHWQPLPAAPAIANQEAQDAN